MCWLGRPGQGSRHVTYAWLKVEGEVRMTRGVPLRSLHTYRPYLAGREDHAQSWNNNPLLTAEDLLRLAHRFSPGRFSLKRLSFRRLPPRRLVIGGCPPGGYSSIRRLRPRGLTLMRLFPKRLSLGRLVARRSSARRFAYIRRSSEKYYYKRFS